MYVFTGFPPTREWREYAGMTEMCHPVEERDPGENTIRLGGCQYMCFQMQFGTEPLGGWR